MSFISFLPLRWKINSEKLISPSPQTVITSYSIHYTKLYDVLILVFISCGSKDSSQKTMSPDEKISIVVGTEKGCPYYEVFYNDKPLIDKSMIGFEFKNAIALSYNFV